MFANASSCDALVPVGQAHSKPAQERTKLDADAVRAARQSYTDTAGRHVWLDIKRSRLQQKRAPTVRRIAAEVEEVEAGIARVEKDRRPPLAARCRPNFEAPLWHWPPESQVRA